MKKIGIVAIVFMLLCPMTLTAQTNSDADTAQKQPAGTAPSGGGIAPAVPKAPGNPQKASRFSSGDLVDLGADRNASRLDDLERRISSLERSQRSQDDNMRQMSRDIDDLKRGVQDFRSTYR